MPRLKPPALPLAEIKIKQHFPNCQLQELITSSRTFPMTARVDVQHALEKVFSAHAGATVRAAQFYLQNGASGALQPTQLNDALEDMLFAGGSLNAKLLGASLLERPGGKAGHDAALKQDQ